MSLDTRPDVDLEVAAPKIFPANALTVDDDEIWIRRRAHLLDAPQCQAVSQVLGLDRRVALELDRLEPLFAGMVDDFVSTSAEHEQTENEKPAHNRWGVRFDHCYLDGCR
jgi:hypothetical protein